MPKHKVDEFGRAKDPQLRHLEGRLRELADEYRRSRRVMSQRKTKTPKIIEEYQATFEKLYALCWDGPLDFTVLLPDKFMPKRYLEKYPSDPNPFTFNPKRNPSASDLERTGELERPTEKQTPFVTEETPTSNEGFLQRIIRAIMKKTRGKT
jgi:hypothetical protein